MILTKQYYSNYATAMAAHLVSEPRTFDIFRLECFFIMTSAEVLINAFCGRRISSRDIVAFIARFLYLFPDMPVDIFVYSGGNIVHIASQKKYQIPWNYSWKQSLRDFQRYWPINTSFVPKYLQKKINFSLLPNERITRSAMFLGASLDCQAKTHVLSQLAVIQIRGNNDADLYHVDLPPLDITWYCYLGGSSEMNHQTALPSFVYNARYEKLFAIRSNQCVYALDFNQDNGTNLQWTQQCSSLHVRRNNTSLCSIDQVSIFLM